MPTRNRRRMPPPPTGAGARQHCASGAGSECEARQALPDIPISRISRTARGSTRWFVCLMLGRVRGGASAAAAGAVCCSRRRPDLGTADSAPNADARASPHDRFMLCTSQLSAPSGTHMVTTSQPYSGELDKNQRMEPHSHKHLSEPAARDMHVKWTQPHMA